MSLRSLLVILITLGLTTGAYARGAGDEQEPSLAQKIKNFFTGPSPTPSKKVQRKPRLGKEKPKRVATPKRSPSPVPAPSESPSGSTLSRGATSADLSATSTLEATVTSTAESGTPSHASSAWHTQTLEPVRPITPPPRKKSPKKQSSPVAEEAPSATPKKAAPEASPGPPKNEKSGDATISQSDIADYDSYPAGVRRVLDLGLSLTNQNLGYKYNSADPANGGMDCSGLIHYLLSQAGIKDVPRDARDQYMWLRKAGSFQPVQAKRNEDAELKGLKPGDLLFWAGSYSFNHDPQITEIMLYLGREKGTNQRLMFGASEGRSYKGQLQAGVRVFDFKPGRSRPKKNSEPGPTFVGYGHIPGTVAD
jgi:peptidoglycan DL-endopeptidase CwlO